MKLTCTHAFVHLSFLYSYSKCSIHLMYCCAVIWFCYVSIYTRQSIISTTSAHTSNRTHLVNMASNFSTQLFLLPQHIPQTQHSNHNYQGVTHMRYYIQGHTVFVTCPLLRNILHFKLTPVALFSEFTVSTW
jgi:hypothetical protein